MGVRDITRYARSWGATDAERQRDWPCDAYVPDADSCYWRAVDVAAPPHVVYRWLCQLRVAPYSYDWIDNFGRRSPPVLTAGVDALARGDRVMTIFALAEFVAPSHLTLLLTDRRARRLFGDIAVTYDVMASGRHATRLAAKLRVRYPSRGLWRCMRLLLPWGDLIMMRKQLLTIKRLAERSHSAVDAGGREPRGNRAQSLSK
jgi:hypothetical protein